jgi:hypothetical protein
MNLARAALRRRHRGIAGALGALVLVMRILIPTARVCAEPARRVVLVVPGAIGPVATEALTRVRGELQAARFEVITEVVAADADRRAAVEREVRRGNARAAFGIFFGGGSAEIWVTDAATGRSAVQTLPLDAGSPERRAAVVAVKAVDLLKATLAEIWINPPVTPLPAPAPAPAGETSPSVAVTSPPTATPAPEARSTDAGGARAGASDVRVGIEEPSPPSPPLVSRVEIAAGAGWLSAGSTSSWAPQTAVSVFDGRIGVRLVASGYGTAVTVESAGIGSVRFKQAFGVGEVVVRQPFGRFFETTASLGGGVYRISGSAVGDDQIQQGHSDSIWSPVVGGGVGAAVTLRRLTIAFDARVLEATTSTSVRIAGDQVALVGRPLIWLGSSIGVRL